VEYGEGKTKRLQRKAGTAPYKTQFRIVESKKIAYRNLQAI
jgi:hypothetical protein